MINLLYSKLLGDSDLEGTYYQRYLSQDATTQRTDIRGLLVPRSGDRSYMNFCAEQLVQLCRQRRGGHLAYAVPGQ